MIKHNRWTLLASSILILLPIVFGLVFWNRLPEQMPTHWGIDGTVNGWSSRPFAVFGLPALLLLLHWVCVFFTMKDPKNKGQNGKIFALVLWTTPIISLFTGGMMYAAAFGKEVQPSGFTALLLGCIFLAVGNYLPKCRQNHTIGIKVKWTLQNEENWNATHRFGGKIWVMGGLLLLACAFLPDPAIILATLSIIPMLVVLPFAYSYRYHKKHP